MPEPQENAMPQPSMSQPSMSQSWIPQPWMAQSAWAGVAEPGHVGTAGASGIFVELRHDMGMASLIAPADGRRELTDAARRGLGLSLPNLPMTAGHDGIMAIWAGPDHWMLLAERASGIEPLCHMLSEFGAMADQSGARAMLRISGPRCREALAKGCMVDLHASTFPVGSVALTSIAHMGVHLWRFADGEHGPVFEIAVARSTTASFWSWLMASCAEFGCTVRGRDPG